jgi:hypothetical protein
MGMFDNIECNYPLPISKDLLDIEELNIYDVQFQTKSLENLMELYVITEDGELLRKKNRYEWVDDDNYFLKGYMDVVSSADVKENFHGIIEFYFYETYLKDVDGKKKEMTVTGEYEAKFVDGKLSSIELVYQSIEDTTEYYEEMRELFKKREIEANKWYNKYILCTKQFRNFKRFFIYKPLDKLHKFTGLLLRLSYRI